jgi:catechol 2,3-dioxygenase-like lactoylglutathione lyase family enzyme
MASSQNDPGIARLGARVEKKGDRKVQSTAMVPKAGYFTPLLHVMDVRRSIRFYELLGFELIDLEGDPAGPGWARMHCEGGAVMFLLAEEPFDPTKHALLTAMYTPDLPAFREHLLANGVAAPAIIYPGYMPSGSLSLRDPDGYIIDIHHWSDAEHTAWLKNVEQKKKDGVLRSSR